MADALSPIQILQNIVAKSINGNAKDDEITLGEVKRSIDSNNDEFISNDELTEVVKNAATVPLPGDIKDRAQLEQAQKLLKQLIDNPKLREKPPQPITSKGLADASLIRNPHELSDSAAMNRWSEMRKSFAGKPINIDLNREVTNIKQLLGNDKNVENLVRALWTNPDSVGGQATNVVRMSELIGAWKHSETDANFRKQFIEEMAKYITDPNNGLDQQFVLDSLLQVIQSTEFAQGQEGLRTFLEDLAKGIADSGDFKGKQGVIGNYDGTREGGVFGSLALVRKADGNLEFVVHDPEVPGQKTKYVLDGAQAGRGADAAPASPVRAGEGNDASKPEPKQLQGNLNEIQGELDDNLEKKIDNKNNADDKQKFQDAKKGLSGIQIPSIIDSLEGLKGLIGHLETLQKLANKYGENALVDKIGSLMKRLQERLDTLSKASSGGIAAGGAQETTQRPAPPARTEGQPASQESKNVQTVEDRLRAQEFINELKLKLNDKGTYSAENDPGEYIIYKDQTDGKIKVFYTGAPNYDPSIYEGVKNNRQNGKPIWIPTELKNTPPKEAWVTWKTPETTEADKVKARAIITNLGLQQDGEPGYIRPGFTGRYYLYKDEADGQVKVFYGGGNKITTGPRGSRQVGEEVKPHISLDGTNGTWTAVSPNSKPHESRWIIPS